MVRVKCALAALLVASVGLPGLSYAQTTPWKRHPRETAAQAHKAAICKAEATKQGLHSDARIDFITSCMAKK